MKCGIVQLDRPLENYPPKMIELDANEIAADAIPQLVEATQADLTERSIVVGRKAGKIIRSEVFQGQPEETDEETGKRLPAHSSMSMLPLGTKSLLRPVRKNTLVHTHPMPSELDHLKTSIISDSDIRFFVGARLVALVTADRGGIHMLVKRQQAMMAGFLPDRPVVGDALRETVRENKSMLDAIETVAHTVHPYGLDYFYTPELNHKDTVQLHNMRYGLPS